MNQDSLHPPRTLTSQHRNVAVQEAYLEHIAHKKTGDTACDMCRLISDRPIALDALNLPFTEVCIIENEFPYENNDGRRVMLHHMLVPRVHFSKASELPESTQNELHATLDALLDSWSYDSAYTRSTYSPTSSVPLHLHTHLFKFGAKVTRQVFDPAVGINDISFDDS